MPIFIFQGYVGRKFLIYFVKIEIILRINSWKIYPIFITFLFFKPSQMNAKQQIVKFTEYNNKTIKFKIKL